MPNYGQELDKDGQTPWILTKDGLKITGNIELEQHYVVASQYFKIALEQLRRSESPVDRTGRRHAGLLCCLTSLIGLEAFTNTAFEVYASERGLSDLRLMIVSTEAKGTRFRLGQAMKLAELKRSPKFDRAFNELKEIEKLRTQIVHPKWSESSFNLPNIAINDLVENPHRIFDDPNCAQACFYWCMVLVAEVGVSFGVSDTKAFLFHWAGMFDHEIPSSIPSIDTWVKTTPTAPPP